MTIYIALLRGINVGGHNIIKMTELKHLFESLGLRNVKTYIQSGNVLFESVMETDMLRQQIEHEIHKVFGYSVPVILRTAMELEQAIQNCPYEVGILSEGESLHISFLAELPSQEGINHLLAFRSEFEECSINEKEIYLFFRQSIRNSKLSTHLQKLGVPGTLRNWKTASKLASMAKEMGE